MRRSFSSAASWSRVPATVGYLRRTPRAKRRLSGGEFSAANSPAGSLPSIRPVHEEPLGHEVLLRVAPILTGPLAIALQLPLQGSHDPVEGEPGRGGHVLDVNGGAR